MLNKEIFIKRPPLLFTQRLLHLPWFHNKGLSYDLKYLFASLIHSLLSLCLSVFCPSDTRLCGTDTWASSKAASLKCITTEGFFFTTRLSLLPTIPSVCRTLPYAPHPPLKPLSLPLGLFSLCFQFVSGDVLGFTSPVITFSPPRLHS